MSAGAALALKGSDLFAQGKLLTRPIPSTGEALPVIGLGSSATFSSVARSEDVDALRDVMRTMVEMGGTVFDTAPSYGASEEVAGRIANENNLADKLFWATKLNVAGRDGTSADPAAARKQVETSFSRIKKDKIDLIQVHNMGDPKVQLPILRELKEKGRLRYMGITTTFEPQYADLIATMKSEPSPVWVIAFRCGSASSSSSRSASSKFQSSASTDSPTSSGAPSAASAPSASASASASPRTVVSSQVCPPSRVRRIRL